MTEKALNLALLAMPIIVLISFLFALLKLYNKMLKLKLAKKLRDRSKSR